MRQLFMITAIMMTSFVYINEIIESAVFLHISYIMAWLMLISGLLFARRFTRILCLSLLALSSFITFFYKIPLAGIFAGVAMVIPLVILFMLVPFISIAIRRGGYLVSLNYYIKAYAESPKSFYALVTGVVFTLGSVMNMVSVRVVHDILEESRLPEDFLLRSYTTGFVSSMVWSPFFTGVTLAVTYAEVRLATFMPYALLYAAGIYLLGLIVYKSDRKGQHKLSLSLQAIEIKEQIHSHTAARKLRMLLINLAFLLMLVLAGERIIPFSSIMYIVSFISVAYGMVWLYTVTDIKTWVQDVSNYRLRIIQMVNEMVFFLTVGILAAAISLSPLQSYVQSFFLGIAETSTILLITSIILSMVFFAAFGISQVATITVLGNVLQASAIGLTPVAYALTFMAGWALSAITSPFVAFNMILRELLGYHPFAIAFRHNIAFKLLFLGLSVIFIRLLTIL